MKAKTYYTEPGNLSLPTVPIYPTANRGMGGDIELKVLKSSDIPKLVERAARALVRLNHGAAHVKRYERANGVIWQQALEEAGVILKSLGLL